MRPYCWIHASRCQRYSWWIQSQIASWVDNWIDNQIDNWVGIDGMIGQGCVGSGCYVLAGCRQVAREMTKHCVSVWGWIPEETLECIIFFFFWNQWGVCFFFLGLFVDFGKADITARLRVVSRHCRSKTVISLWIL